MTSVDVTEHNPPSRVEAASAKGVDDLPIDEPVSRAQTETPQLTDEGGLKQLTRRLLESALKDEIAGRLGYPGADTRRRPVHVCDRAAIPGGAVFRDLVALLFRTTRWLCMRCPWHG